MSLDVEQVCEHLFAGNALGNDVTRTFDETYSGESVSWTGIVDRVDSYYSDYIFGRGPGAKVTVKIHELTGTGYGANSCIAVVQVDEVRGADLKDRRGDSVSFKGTLVKCEPYMRTLFVAE
jgi:hypothetical protein